MILCKYSFLFILNNMLEGMVAAYYSFSLKGTLKSVFLSTILCASSKSILNLL